MSDLRRYLDLKERADKARRDADRAAGALSHVMTELEERFGCGTMGEAEALLEERREFETKQAEALTAALDAYQEEFDGEG